MLLPNLYSTHAPLSFPGVLTVVSNPEDFFQALTRESVGSIALMSFRAFTAMLANPNHRILGVTTLNVSWGTFCIQDALNIRRFIWKSIFTNN